MRILKSLVLLPLLTAPLAAAGPAPQAPTRASIINQKSPGPEGGPAGGSGCNIARCPDYCQFSYGPMAGMSMCYAGPKSCDWIDSTTNRAHCTCERGHSMPVCF